MKLTPEQARQLKWFCNNCTGLYHEHYAVQGQLTKFTYKLERLLKTCELIENFLSQQPLGSGEMTTDKPKRSRRG